MAAVHSAVVASLFVLVPIMLGDFLLDPYFDLSSFAIILMRKRERELFI